MRTSRANRHHNYKMCLDQNKVQTLITWLQNSNISYADLESRISFFETLGQILRELEIRLPSSSLDPSGVPRSTPGSQGQGQLENYVEQLQRIRRVSIALLHGKDFSEINGGRGRDERKRKVSTVLPASTSTAMVSSSVAELKQNTSTEPKMAKFEITPKNACFSQSTSNGRKRRMLGCLDICYVCKIQIPEPFVCESEPSTTPTQLRHAHYPWMCLKCGDFNLNKRQSSADLTGKVAIVTGGRMKIGYEIVLKLLRANCKTVIVTTRFPVDAYKRFEAEPDFALWSSRLRLYKLDLRFLGAVNQFCKDIHSNFEKVDILIQNAAQTIRRPAVYYKELIKAELEFPANFNKHMLLNTVYASPFAAIASDHDDRGSASDLGLLRAGNPENTGDYRIQTRSMSRASCLPTSSTSSSSHPSQLLVHPEDFTFAADSKLTKSMFPAGRTDEDGNQLDLRKRNTWIMDLEEVEPVEMAECQLVNYMAPFIILQKLTPLMRRPESSKDLGYIVLVSAMEGKFECFKTGKHPHTNAAKAALNMLVRTSAKHYYDDLGLVLNAVDTGWVTDEHPVGHPSRLPVPPPLDIVDGAARVLDPIFHSINNPNMRPLHGKFLKDYGSTSW